MEISQIGSMADLINFYEEKDINRNGFLETSEIENVSRHDRDGDNALSPWEVMETVNFQRSAQIFRPDEIAYSRHLILYSRQLNDTGEAGFDECGQPIEGGRNIRYFTYGGVLFYCRLPAPCSMASSYPASFYSNGQLKFARLAEDTAIKGITFWSGTEIGFYESGHPEWANLYRDTNINGMTFENGSAAHFYESGAVSSGTIVQDSTYIIEGITFGGGTVEFYESGQVKSGRLAESTILQGMLFGRLSLLSFYEDGGISRAFSSGSLGAVTISTATFDSADFYQNGNISRGWLVSDALIQGIIFKKETKIEFHENGRVSRGTRLTEWSDDDGIIVEFDENGRRVR